MNWHMTNDRLKIQTGAGYASLTNLYNVNVLAYYPRITVVLYDCASCDRSSSIRITLKEIDND